MVLKKTRVEFEKVKHFLCIIGHYTIQKLQKNELKVHLIPLFSFLSIPLNAIRWVLVIKIKYKLAPFSNQLNGYKFALLTTGLLLLILSVIISRLVCPTSLPPHLHNCQHQCGNLNTTLCLWSSGIRIYHLAHLSKVYRLQFAWT